jgi:endonuclease YncB( thermonuclease family)/predicted flap endonuclease-1-like 5' DNA nuclease
MWRKFSTRTFATAGIARLRCAVALVALAVLWIAAFDLCARDDWTLLENCHFISNPADDGDSFHVSAGAKEYIFRLYLADAPETDEMNPVRVAEQAKYFAISAPQVIEVGQAAKEFTREKLSQPFAVLTRWKGAMGRSKMERFYAFVQTTDGDLGEQLVRNGLARNYGFRAAPPGSKNARVEAEKLQEFEDQARQEKIGAWGINAGRLNVRAPSTVVFTVFAVGEKPRPGARPPDYSSARASATPSPMTSAVEPSRSHAKEKTPLGKIDINTATEKELTSVPGIGHVMAARIIAARPFRSADDLKRVSGIGEKKYTQIRPYFQ